MALNDKTDPKRIIEAIQTREPHYWAFCANPHIYQIREAVHGLEVDYWAVGNRDVREGDFAAIWQSNDADGHRGIVAFAEVLSDPMEIEDFENPYWVRQNDLQKRSEVLVKYYVSPQLPLWIDESDNGKFIGSLSVARGRGGTIFRINLEEWGRLLDLSGISETLYLRREAARPEEEERFSLEELFEKAKEGATAQASFKERKANYYQRSKFVRLYALKKANGKCQYCGKEAPFLNKKGKPYLEVHHLRRLSDGGPDDPKWVVALCPNCHSRIHNGEDGKTINDNLIKTEGNQ